MADGARLASRFGASSFLYGTLVGSGGVARLDLELIDPGRMATLAHVSVAAPRDDIKALTDSATLELLRRVWKHGAPPAPDLGAITTRSVPALRAYLEGELAFIQSRYDVAVAAFERSFAADSTFSLAYWRSLYPRIYEGAYRIPPSSPESSLTAIDCPMRKR